MSKKEEVTTIPLKVTVKRWLRKRAEANNRPLCREAALIIENEMKKELGK